MGLRFFAVLLLLPATLTAEEWVSDSDGSLTFEAGFEGDPLPGEFPEFTVRFSDQSLIVNVNVAASDMGDEEMNSILHDPTWLAVEQHADARYTSTDVRCGDDGDCVSTGELQLKGLSRPLDVPFTFRVDGDVAELSGELEMNRTDFDVGSGMWSTGDSIDVAVTLRFDIRLTRGQ